MSVKFSQSETVNNFQVVTKRTVRISDSDVSCSNL